MEKRKIRNDIILILILLVIAIGTMIPLLLLRKRNDLIAKVYVQNEVVETIDLSKKKTNIITSVEPMEWLPSTLKMVLLLSWIVIVLIMIVSIWDMLKKLIDPLSVLIMPSILKLSVRNIMMWRFNDA